MSYEIAATGLNAVNEQLDGISNNIANAGTVGYKSMTTQFSAMYAGSQAMGVSVAGTAQSICAAVRWSPPATRWIWRLTTTAFLLPATARATFPTPARDRLKPTKTAILSTPRALICRAIRSMTLALCKPVRSPISR